MHVFPEDMWHLLESEERKKREPAERLAEIIKERIRRRKVAFDIGAGTGYFTVQLSKLFEKVYAVERSEKLARILASKASKTSEASKTSKGLKNIGIIVSEKPPEIDFDVDLVLFADSLHEISCKKEYVEWCCSRSKYVLIVDWKKGVCQNAGPPDSHRIGEDDVAELFSCYKFEKFDIYPCHYVLLGVRQK